MNPIDGDKLNNRAENLEWYSHSHNSQHAHDTDLIQSLSGDPHQNTEISVEDARKILNRYVPRCRTNGTRAIAREYGVGAENHIKHCLR